MKTEEANDGMRKVEERNYLNYAMQEFLTPVWRRHFADVTFSVCIHDERQLGLLEDVISIVD